MTAEPTDERRRVVIACQGGGSHTAFTAGVLRRLLDGPEIDEYDVVGLSGTSGGAVCALLAWTALRDGDRHKARALLDGFWADNAASTPTDVAINAWMMWAATLQSAGWLPSVSPYDLPVDGLGQFRELLRHRVDFDAITADPDGPLLVVGAVDVLSGRFRAFHSRREQITADMILASAAIPNIFPAVHTDGGTYWDGLFSQNPPVHELLDASPDELWVIQINPTARYDEPKTVLDITDRRNELAGNLSLYQELHAIEVIDRLLADGKLVDSPYRQVTVRVLEFARPASSRPPGRRPRSTATPGSCARSWSRVSGRPRSSSPPSPSNAPGGPRTSTRCSATSRRTWSWRSPARSMRTAAARTPTWPSCAAAPPWTSPASSSPATARCGTSGCLRGVGGSRPTSSTGG